MVYFGVPNLQIIDKIMPNGGGGGQFGRTTLWVTSYGVAGRSRTNKSSFGNGLPKESDFDLSVSAIRQSQNSCKLVAPMAAIKSCFPRVFYDHILLKRSF
jgi:hypothetical protein